MHLRISVDQLRAILGRETLSPAEVGAIARLAFLAAEIDFDEDTDELDALDELTTELYTMSELPVASGGEVSPLPIDDEERTAAIHELADVLESRGARELAYVISYLLAVSDLELAPIESRYLDELQHALSISDERAADLVSAVGEAVTPGMRETTSDTSMGYRH